MTTERMLAKLCMSVAFFISAVTLPWWATLGVGILALALTRSYLTVVVGGVVLDMLFGSPQPYLLGISTMYTFMFAILAFIAWFLESRVLE